MHSGKAFDPDDPEHMKWVYNEVNKVQSCSDLKKDIFMDFHFYTHFAAQ